MRLRPAPLLALTIGLAAGATGSAAVKPYCNLLVDPEGDGDMTTAPMSSPALDIISGDVATGGKEMVGVLRLKSLDVSNDPAARLFSFDYDLSVDVQGVQYRFWARRPLSPTGANPTWSSGMTVGSDAIDGAVWKVNGNALEWRVPRSKLKGLAKPRLVFLKIRGTTSAFGGSADGAITETAKYPDRAASCVKAL